MKDDRLVGIVTEHDFIEIAYNLLAVELREN
jgi:CBS domain-containing protein